MTKGANCIVIYNDSFLMLLRDKISSISNPNKWCLLGGNVEEGETFDQAIERELLEEANLKLTEYRLLGYLKGKENISALYVCYLSQDQLLKIRLGDEGQTLGFFRLDKLIDSDLVDRYAKSIKKFAPALEKLLLKENVMASEFGLVEKDSLFNEGKTQILSVG